jgi:hypothetical protein
MDPYLKSLVLRFGLGFHSQKGKFDLLIVSHSMHHILLRLTLKGPYVPGVTKPVLVSVA